MPVLHPGAEVKFDSFHRGPVGFCPEGRKANLLVLITVHLLLVFVSSKSSSYNWEWHFGNVGNATEEYPDFPHSPVYFVIFLVIVSTNSL